MALQNNKDRVIFDRIRPEPDPEHGSPICRSSHGLSALVDARGKFHRLILYGGENVARTPITDAAQVLWLAQKDSNAQNEGGSSSGGWRWVSLSPNDNDRPTPPSRVAHSQAAVGHAVYIFGGRGGVDIGETALNDLWKLDIVYCWWMQGRERASARENGRKLFLAGVMMFQRHVHSIK